MSEIKVNKISPRSGTEVTLGDSGDTFTIPSGATINNQGTATNFGATGSASWSTTVKTSTFTAVAGEGYFVNTTGGVVTVNLPAGTAGDVVAIKDYAGTFDTNAVTLVQNGSDKVGGSTVNPTLGTEGLAVTLVFIDSTQGWLVTDSGLQDEAPTAQYVTATGGTITCSGNFKIHTFTGPGTFQVTCAGNADGSTKIDYLVVAGGGAGTGVAGSGAGAGGFRLSNETCMSAPQTSPLATPTGITASVASFPITVGAGGTAPNPAAASAPDGSPSIFSTITSAGGGGSVGAANNGQSGGSGSGGGGENLPGPSTAGAGNTPSTTPAQGNPGGTGGQSPSGRGAGGGGGASAAGQAGGAPGGDGGAGSFVVGTGFAGCNGTPGPVSGARYFSGGGGGGYEAQGGHNGEGGDGGGADAGPGPGTGAGNGQAGTANTGGGGGGASRGAPGSNDGQIGGNGGSGIVVIRYKFQ